MRHVITLEITSFRGISSEAKHYYGKLIRRDPYECVSIKKKMTKGEAEKLSRRDSFSYREGNTTERFESEDEIRKIAVETYKNIFPGAIILIEGYSASADPKKVLDAPEKVMKKGNLMYREVDGMKWYGRGMYRRSEKDEKRVDVLSKRYYKLLESYGEK